MQMCLLYILFRSESLSCQELYQHVSWVEETSDLSGNISDKQTQCYDISQQPKHWEVWGGDGGAGGGGVKPQKGDLFTLAHAPFGQLKTKQVFYYSCCVVGEGGGKLPVFVGLMHFVS